MDDSKIIALLWARAENAIEALAQKYGPRLYGIARNILGDHHDAEECVNDTYLALWNTIPPQNPDPLIAYACRISRNTALTRLRNDSAQRRCSEYDLSLDELSGCISAPSLEETLDARTLGKAINAFLGTVSQDSRIIFLRRYWFGDSVKEIAQALSMTENAVSVRLNRTRNKLKAYLIKEGIL